MIKRNKIVNLYVTLTSFEEAIQQVTAFAVNKKKMYACFANAHMVVEARDEQFARQVNQADFVFTDGKPLTWALRFLYGIRQERIAGMDFFPAFLQKCHDQQLSVFFYGSSQKVLHAIKQRIANELPNCKVVGSISPPFRPLTTSEIEEHIRQINESGANVVFVSLGCPKQEKWCAENSLRINAPLLAVGGAFAVYAGMQKRAPQYMQNVGLEWLYRLLQEPQRLWKRYLFTNSMFVWEVCKQKIFSKK